MGVQRAALDVKPQLLRFQDKIEGAAGASDSVTALRSWQRHKEIHNSMVVDLFQGQYRSQLVCPQCHRLSVTFDPFLNLSLPLPHAAFLCFNIAGSFEVSKAFSAEVQAKLPLSQAKAKDLALVLYPNEHFIGGALNRICTVSLLSSCASPYATA